MEWARFQFTRPRGARPVRLVALVSLNSFQFTRPRGARPFRRRLSSAFVPFQFTRPRGARLLKCIFLDSFG